MSHLRGTRNSLHEIPAFTKFCRVRASVSLLITLGLYTSLAAAADNLDCRQAVIAYPAQDETLTNARPEIRWGPIAGVSNYHVRLRSRIPEGAVVINIDTLVRGERFVPPRPLSDFRAIVRVIVSSGCGSGAPQVESGVRFFIDTAPLCVLDEIKPESSDPATLSWNPVANAIEYEAWFYQMPESTRAEKTITRETRVRVPAKVKLPAVVAIRPRCASGYGELRLIEIEQ